MPQPVNMSTVNTTVISTTSVTDIPALTPAQARHGSVVNSGAAGFIFFIILDLLAFLEKLVFPSISITQCYVMVTDETRDAEGECDR